LEGNIMKVSLTLLALGLLAPCAGLPQTEEPTKTSASQAAPERLSSAEAKRREEWRKSMSQVPLPKKGCFESAYPNKGWKEVTCKKPPEIPMPPRRGSRPEVVGNANDVSAQAPSGFIATATGSFDSVTGVTSVTSPIGNSGSSVANAYTLQLNTDFFTSTACAGSPNPGCRGWEQFVFFNDGTSGDVFIQYWLLRYNANCPAGGGWNQFSFTGGTDIYCWRNSPTGVGTPNQPITGLQHMHLTGAVTATGDSITFASGSNTYATTGSNSVHAASGWRIAEFNVFGAGGNSSGGGEASFNSGSTVVPRTMINYGGNAPPLCSAQGFTGETNNLNFGPGAPAVAPPGPAVFFTESIAGGSMTNCAAATSVGDTHLGTFGGLLYDFQASGDFVLAEVDPGFQVQVRQVSGAPTWPNASVNHAVATRMGKDQIAVCLGREPLHVNGKHVGALGDGQALALPDGTTIRRKGNAYFIIGETGNSVRAEINDGWINVAVGLGQWPVKVRGLAANANNNVNQLATRDGIVLTNPFSFTDMYQRYATSWRVHDSDSLLSQCGEGVGVAGPPKPFDAHDLDPRQTRRAVAACEEAGIKQGPLLDACILDVAVIGKDAAARAFAGAQQPAAVGKIRGDTKDIAAKDPYRTTK